MFHLILACYNALEVMSVHSGHVFKMPWIVPIIGVFKVSQIIPNETRVQDNSYILY